MGLANLFGLGKMSLWSGEAAHIPQMSHFSGALGTAMIGKLALRGAATGAVLGLGTSLYNRSSLGDTLENTMVGAGLGAVSAPMLTRMARSGISAYRLGRMEGLGVKDALKATPRRAGRMFTSGVLQDTLGAMGEASLKMARVGTRLNISSMRWTGLTAASSFFAAQGRSASRLGLVGAKPLTNATLFGGGADGFGQQWAKSRIQVSGLL